MKELDEYSRGIGEKGRQTDSLTYRQRQRDRQTDRQTDSLTYRQRHRQKDLEN